MSNLDSRLYKFADYLCSQRFGKPVGKVDEKFIKNMFTGIWQTRSVNLTEIARSLNENIRLHATHKRLSRNLDNLELQERLSSGLLKMVAEHVKPETRLLVHVHEITKKYACKIEFLSDKEADSKAGFKVCEILATHPNSKDYMPMLARVWSDQTPQYQCDETEIQKAVKQVLEATENRGILHFDDRSLKGNLIQQLMRDSKANFVAMVDDVNLVVNCRGVEATLSALCEDIETPYGKMMFKLVPEGVAGTSSQTDMDLFMHVGSLPVKLLGNPRRLSLIALKSKNRLVGDHVTPLITSLTRLRSRKALMGLVESFLSIHDVIGLHSELRDQFNPSGFRVLTYNRLQLLLTMLQAVICAESSLPGKVAVVDQQYSRRPHDGDLTRTYYRPEEGLEA